MNEFRYNVQNSRHYRRARDMRAAYFNRLFARLSGRVGDLFGRPARLAH